MPKGSPDIRISTGSSPDSLASGVGYAIWYTALPFLKSMTAATVQLAVPVIAALGGVFLLGEPLTPRLVAASMAILGGVALVVALGGKGRGETLKE